MLVVAFLGIEVEGEVVRVVLVRSDEDKVVLEIFVDVDELADPFRRRMLSQVVWRWVQAIGNVVGIILMLVQYEVHIVRVLT